LIFIDCEDKKNDSISNWVKS